MKPRSRIRPLSATLASALAAIMIPGCASMEPVGGATTTAPAPVKKVVRGSIVYRERVALPADAELNVRLLDETRPDRPVLVATATTPTAGRQVPLPFALEFDPAKTSQGRRYALHATIRAGGKIRYVTATRVNIDVLNPPTTLTMMVVPGDDEPTFEDAPMPNTGRRSYPPGAR